MGIVVIPWYRLKAVRFIETHGFPHFRRVSIEPHPFVTDLSCIFNKALDKLDTDLLPAKICADKETLHLANALFQLSQSYTAGELFVRVREKEFTFRCHIFTRQAGKLLFEPPKAQIESEPRFILTKECLGLRYLRSCLG